jgi:hypothetical protein
MALPPATRLGSYEIAELLGAGGMGEVYRARDTRLDREVALKVLRSEVATDPDRLRRFEQEAKTVAALNHPHILTVHDVGTHEGSPYVVTELLEGETLRQVLKSRSPTQKEVLTLTRRLRLSGRWSGAWGTFQRCSSTPLDESSLRSTDEDEELSGSGRRRVGKPICFWVTRAGWDLLSPFPRTGGGSPREAWTAPSGSGPCPISRSHPSTPCRTTS